MEQLTIKTVVKVTDPEFTELFGSVGKITDVSSSLYYVVPAEVKGKDGMWVKGEFLSVYDAEAEAAEEAARKEQEEAEAKQAEEPGEDEGAGDEDA